MDESLEFVEEESTADVVDIVAPTDPVPVDSAVDPVVSGSSESTGDAGSDPAGESETVSGAEGGGPVNGSVQSQNYQSMLESILRAVQDLAPDPLEAEEELSVVPLAYADTVDGLVSYDAVSFECNGSVFYFPSDYADDLHLVDGQLVNLGASYTFGAVVSGYSASNYIVSEVTVPTYHSSTWYQYLNTYGQPYRVVDRYRNNYGNYSSETRQAVSLSFTGGNDWAGFSTQTLLLFGIFIAAIVLVAFRRSR